MYLQNRAYFILLVQCNRKSSFNFQRPNCKSADVFQRFSARKFTVRNIEDMSSNKENVKPHVGKKLKEKLTVKKRKICKQVNGSQETDEDAPTMAVVRKFKNRPKRAVSQLGYLDFLPVEIQMKILRLLSGHGLAKLATCSKAASHLVLDFLHLKHIVRLTTVSCLRPGNATVNVEKCCDLGRILRGATATFDLSQLIEVLATYLGLVRDELNASADTLNHVMLDKRLLAVGYVVNTVVQGRDSKDLAKVVRAVEGAAAREGYDFSVRDTTGVANAAEEMALRRLYRCFFLDAASSESQRAVWLHAILHPLSIKQRARMLFLIAGPVNNVYMWNADGGLSLITSGSVLWTMLPHFQLTSRATMHFMLGELGSALRELYALNLWSQPQFFAMLRDMIKLPAPWAPYNTAMLLLLTGEQLVTSYMVHQSLRCMAVMPAVTVYPNFNGIYHLEKLGRSFLHLIAAQQMFLDDLRAVSLSRLLERMMHHMNDGQMRRSLLKTTWRMALFDLQLSIVEPNHGNNSRLLTQYRVLESLRVIQDDLLSHLGILDH